MTHAPAAAASPSIYHSEPAGPGDAGGDPVRLALGVGAVVLAGFALRALLPSYHLAQQATAALAVLAFAAALRRSPRDGLVLLFLLPPLFNGEDRQPYFFLLEILVLLTLVRGWGPALLGRAGWGAPAGGALLLVAGAAAAAVPLDARETWLAFQVLPWRAVLEDLRRADPGGDFSYLRGVYLVATGAALCALAARQAWPARTLERLALAAAAMLPPVVLAGYWFARHPAPRGTPTFLTLWLGGANELGYVGLGFSVAYFAEYALAYLPLVFLVLVGRGSGPWARGLALAGLVLGTVALLHTHERAAYALLLLEAALLAGVALRGPGGLRRVPGAGRWVLAAAAAAAVAVALATPRWEVIWRRIGNLWTRGDPVREAVLGDAIRMAGEAPLLGVGTGRFAPAYRGEYRPFGFWTAHNIYAQLLAEQGVLGLLAFLLLVGLVLAAGVRAWRRPGTSPFLGVLLVSLVVWLAYGLVQYTLLLRSLQLYFWLALGLVLALAGRPALSRWQRRAAGGLALLLLGALVVRLPAVAARPVSAGFARGFYPVEPGGHRWTRGPAVAALDVAGPILRLRLACPPAPAAGLPQHVTIRLDGRRVAAVELGAPGWRVVEIPVGPPAGRRVVLGLDVRHRYSAAALGLNDDPRPLGVLLAPPEWDGA